MFCLGFFCRARRPAPFSWCPALLKKPKWRPALLNIKYQSHMDFSSVLPFLLPTHSVDCDVHLLLSHSRALLVSSALFHPFTVLIMPFFFRPPALKCPFDGPFTALKCPFDGPFTALKCPFQMAPCPFENLGRTLETRCLWESGSPLGVWYVSIWERKMWQRLSTEWRQTFRSLIIILMWSGVHSKCLEQQWGKQVCQD